MEFRKIWKNHRKKIDDDIMDIQCLMIIYYGTVSPTVGEEAELKGFFDRVNREIINIRNGVNETEELINMGAIMEINFWNRYFKTIVEVNSKIPDYISSDASMQELRTVKKILNAEKANILRIYSTLESVNANIDLYQQRHDIDLANKMVLEMKSWTNKLYEVVNRDIMQHSINTAILTSINIFRHKLRPAYDKINGTFDKFEKLISDYDPNLLRKFDSIFDHKRKTIESSCENRLKLIEKRFAAANSGRHISKIYDEVKNIISDEIKNVTRIHLSFVFQIKLLLNQSTKKLSKTDKRVSRKNNNHTYNAFHQQIFIQEFFPSMLNFEFLFNSIRKILKFRSQSNFNWKKKKKKSK